MVELVTCLNWHAYIIGNGLIGGRNVGKNKHGRNCREAVFMRISEGFAESEGINLPKRLRVEVLGQD